jgi:hypothetical protein
MALRDLAAAVVIVVATGAVTCAHKPREPAPSVVAFADSHRDWLGQLPRCDPQAKAIDVDSLANDAKAMSNAEGQRGTHTDPGTVAVRGALILSTEPQCTLMRCLGSECCNSCFPRWVLVSAEPPTPDWPYAREIAIHKAGESEPMAVGMRDCDLKAVRKLLPRAQVIVTGTVQRKVFPGVVAKKTYAQLSSFELTITEASICLVSSLTPRAPSWRTDSRAASSGTRASARALP